MSTRSATSLSALPALLLIISACGGDGSWEPRSSDPVGEALAGISAEKRIEEIVELSRKVTAGVDSPTTTVYLLRPGGSPPSGSVARVGGDPIGVGDHNWPVFNGEPMEHLLTLDLEAMPTLRDGPLAEARAISLFIADRIMNEAFLPGTEETAIVALSEADVQRRGRGEVRRAAGSPARALEVTAVEVPSQALTYETDPEDRDLENLRGLLFDASAYAGGEPLWLQQPEHEGHFLLQFDESFIDMNLGDAGVMYVFSDTAFWQCH